MVLLRAFLIAAFCVIAGYTAIVIGAHGSDFIPLFNADILGMTWRGQFNTDFLCFLLLSGIWVSWRSDFSPAGLVLGVVAVFGGMLFLSAYLLIASFAARGDAAALLLGSRRAAARA
jgi:NADH:ubiquinone oxidoreductase subunit 2 (subunit N)